MKHSLNRIMAALFWVIAMAITYDQGHHGWTIFMALAAVHCLMLEDS